MPTCTWSPQRCRSRGSDDTSWRRRARCRVWRTCTWRTSCCRTSPPCPPPARTPCCCWRWSAPTPGCSPARTPGQSPRSRPRDQSQLSIATLWPITAQYCHPLTNQSSVLPWRPAGWCSARWCGAGPWTSAWISPPRMDTLAVSSLVSSRVYII